MTYRPDLPSDLRQHPAWNGPAVATGPPRAPDGRLRALRLAAGLTQAAMVAACPALPLPTLRAYEQGRRRTPAVVLAYVRERLAGRMAARGVVTTGDGPPEPGGAGAGLPDPDAE